MTGTGLKPAYVEPTDPVVRDVRLNYNLINILISILFFFSLKAFDKLSELGMKEEDEDKIIRLKLFVKQTPQYKLK